MQRRVTGLLATGLATLAASGAAGAALVEPLTAENYGKDRASKGVVLVAVRWSALSPCAQYDTTQLRQIAFDRYPTTKGPEEAPDLSLDSPPPEAIKAVYQNYAFLAEPGEYAMSNVRLRVTRGGQPDTLLHEPRPVLIRRGMAEGGTFTVEAGETVYIGHFHVECHKWPRVWRYYTNGREAFGRYLGTVKKEWPMLEVEKTEFRLFQTRVYGFEYQLR